MKPIVNLEEIPGKVVGRVRPVRYDDLVAMAEGIMPHLPFPKGVFRFRTHKKANAWMDRNILQGALKKARARHDKKT
jgi:hypothetical protein